MASDITIRVAGAGDLDEILHVCSAALNWNDPDWDRKLFTWKHDENAFGPSLVLLAEDSTGILAVRPLMQWRFSSHEGSVRAARAVDTATRPDAQRRGLFTSLTEVGLERLRSRGVAFIFNTPNGKSRPAYEKLGWHDAGRVEFGIRLRSASSLPRVLRSKVAATKPSVPTPDLGIDPTDFIDQISPLARRQGRKWRTDHDLDSLRWRYVRGPVTYRALPMSEQAGAIVRVRQRGHSRELLVAEQLGIIDEETERSVLAAAMKDVRADHLIGAARTPGTLRSHRVGPPLTMREVAVYHPDPKDMAWAPGDLELF